MESDFRVMIKAVKEVVQVAGDILIRELEDPEEFLKREMGDDSKPCLFAQIQTLLKRHVPHLECFSDEIPATDALLQSGCFLCLPIDGKVAYTSHNKGFGVMLAYVEERTALVGAICLPLTLTYQHVSSGAVLSFVYSEGVKFCNSRLNTRALMKRAKGPLRGELISSTESNYSCNELQLELEAAGLLAPLSLSSRSLSEALTRMLASELDCFLLLGKLDAAKVLIPLQFVIEAGGFVSDLNGMRSWENLATGKACQPLIFARNESIAVRLLSALSPEQKAKVIQACY